jgi:hypothetical protein
MAETQMLKSSLPTSASRQGGEKILSADKFRQNPTRGLFPAEIGPAKKTSPRRLPRKVGQKAEKTWKSWVKNRFFQEFSRQRLAVRRTNVTQFARMTNLGQANVR